MLIEAKNPECAFYGQQKFTDIKIAHFLSCSLLETYSPVSTFAIYPESKFSKRGVEITGKRT